jgi:hypothetical protein
LLQRFFAVFSLFGSRPASQKRSLSSLFAEIRRRGPSWYDPWTDRRSDDSAEAVERLRKSCARMAKVYLRSVDGPIDAEEAAAAAVLDSALAEAGGSLKSLTFEAIRADVESSQAVDLLEAMDALFQQRIAALRAEPVARAAAAYGTNQRLASLCRFKFDGLLAPYAPKKTGSRRRRHVVGERLAAEVADLHYLIAGLKPDADARRVFLELRALADPEGYPADVAAADYNALTFVLGGPLRSDAVGRVVRAIRMDASFALRSDHPTGDIRASITSKATEEYAARRALTADRIAQEALEAQIFAVFGDIPMLPVEGWSEPISDSFAAVGLPRLSHLRSLPVLKSFMAALFFPIIRPAVSNAIVDFDFADRHFRSALSDEADEAARVAEDLSAFEESVSSHGRSEFARIVAALEAKEAEKVGTILARRTIDDAKAFADRTIEGAIARFSALLSHLETICDDLKSRAPQVVVNAAVVNAQKRTLVQNLEKSAHLLGLFLDLLRRVVASAHRERAGKAAALIKK